MPRIPLVTSEVDPRTLRGNAPLVPANASPEAFGAGIGDALQRAAGGISDLGAGIQAYQEKRRAETVANSVAQSDFTPRELVVRQATPADGAGYYENVMDEYDKFVDQQAELIDDDVARLEYKQRMMAQRPNVSSRSATYQFGIAAENSKAQADASLSGLQNRIMANPDEYDALISQGIDVLDTRQNMPATVKEGMKISWRQNGALARFQGMLERATTVEQVDAIARELTSTTPVAAGGVPPEDRKAVRDWTKEFQPEDYTRMVNNIGTVRSQILTQADVNARAALDTIEDRAKDINILIPKEELSTVQQVVKQSRNPVTISRMARIMRDQDVIEQSRRQTPAQLRSDINAANGNAAIAYPGVPPIVSDGINAASSTFGISAGFIGGTIQREYGGYLKSPKARGKPQFAPVPLRSGVDLGGVRNEVRDAAAVAGEMFGAPLQITSAFRTAGHQARIRNKPGTDPNRVTVAKESHHTDREALDISTVGMTPADKARLIASLADAGFTGFGEYGTHVHADFRDSVPSSFGKGGTNWGGWTQLSPDVMQVLKDRGFAAGMSSQQIRRNGPAPVAGEEIDYGIKNPVSSATGLGQHIDSTWLHIVKTYGVQMGVDITDMTENEMLELRKDPRLSIMGIAAYAAENKAALESSLGRPVSDPDLYVAHFLGAGGATALLGALTRNPNGSAAALLPKAAADNHNVFYDKSGRARTIQEVYTNISTSFNTQPSQVAYGDNQTRQRVLDNMDKGLADDPMTYAQQVGTTNITDLSGDGAFAARGNSARAVADYYNIPLQEMQPFTNDEANSIAKAMKDGSVDDVLGMMEQIQSMGPEMARAALAQLDQKDTVYAYAAGLQAERGDTAVASDIVRGQKRIQENPNIKDSIGANPQELNDAFVTATGDALSDVSPRVRQAMQEAATAHYVETVVARGAAAGFDADAYAASVQAVVGSQIDDVNNEKTILPPGIDGDTMEAAFDNMTVTDWARMSEQNLPPRYVTGEVVDPEDIQDEATLRPIGANKYKVMLSDGSFLVTGRQGPNGRIEAYIFAPDPKEISRLASIPNTAVTAPRADPRTKIPAMGDQEIDPRLKEMMGN
jgi:hypothetical protein